MTAGKAVCTENCAHCHRATGQGEGRRGAGACVMASQARQENFSRTCAITFHWRGISSSVSVHILPDLAQPLVATAWADRNVIAKLNAAAKGAMADRARSAGRSRRRHSAARPANSRGTRCSSKVRNREVVADHQGCQHPGGVRPDARTKPQGLECCENRLTGLTVGWRPRCKRNPTISEAFGGVMTSAPHGSRAPADTLHLSMRKVVQTTGTSK
jgi:hypothetical protein